MTKQRMYISIHLYVLIPGLQLVTLEGQNTVKQLHGFVYILGLEQALGMLLAEGARQPPLPLLLTKTGAKKISIMAS